jgi:MYXO-CTERM domain-containing protein
MRRAAVIIATLLLALAARPCGATLLLNTDGSTVLDTSTGLTWLENADLPASQAFGLDCSPSKTTDCVNPNGSMNWVTAVNWVRRMNNADYLGHDNWQLPATASFDPGCTATGTHGNSFAFNCSGSAFGALYYNALGLTAPNSALPPAQNTVGLFSNFQPNNYWSGTKNPSSGLGYLTFSYATGLGDSIVGANSTDPSNPNKITSIGGTFLNVLPMIPGTPIGPRPLQSALGGQGVFDPATGATWAADANLAATFAKSPTLMAAIGMSLCNGVGTVGVNTAPNCINANGTMNWPSANQFVTALRGIAYLGQTGWTLPPIGNQGCLAQACSDPALNPMAYLYYNQFGLKTGTSVAPTPAVVAANDPFQNWQPEYYWSCEATNDACPIGTSCDYQSTLPAPDFGWDFSLGNGYESTDLKEQYFFVTAYYVPEPPGWALLFPALGLAGIAARRRRRLATTPR